MLNTTSLHQSRSVRSKLNAHIFKNSWKALQSKQKVAEVLLLSCLGNITLKIKGRKPNNILMDTCSSQNQQIIHLMCQKKYKEKLLSILLILYGQHQCWMDSTPLSVDSTPITGLSKIDYKKCFQFASQLHSYSFGSFYRSVK